MQAFWTLLYAESVNQTNLLVSGSDYGNKPTNVLKKNQHWTKATKHGIVKNDIIQKSIKQTNSVP